MVPLIEIKERERKLMRGTGTRGELQGKAPRAKLRNLVEWKLPVWSLEGSTKPLPAITDRVAGVRDVLETEVHWN